MRRSGRRSSVFGTLQVVGPLVLMACAPTAPAPPAQSKDGAGQAAKPAESKPAGQAASTAPAKPADAAKPADSTTAKPAARTGPMA